MNWTLFILEYITGNQDFDGNEIDVNKTNNDNNHYINKQ